MWNCALQNFKLYSYLFFWSVLRPLQPTFGRAVRTNTSNVLLSLSIDPYSPFKPNTVTSPARIFRLTTSMCGLRQNMPQIALVFHPCGKFIFSRSTQVKLFVKPIAMHRKLHSSNSVRPAAWGNVWTGLRLRLRPATRGRVSVDEPALKVTTTYDYYCSLVDVM